MAGAARWIGCAGVAAMLSGVVACADVTLPQLPPPPDAHPVTGSSFRDPAFSCTLPPASGIRSYPSCTGDVNYAGDGLDLRFTPWTAGEPFVYGGIPSDATSVEITVEGRRTVVRRWRTR